MAEHPKVALIKAAYAAGRGDTAALNDLFAEDIPWHAGGRLQQASDYRGREAVFGFLGKLRELAGDPSPLRPPCGLCGRRARRRTDNRHG